VHAVNAQKRRSKIGEARHDIQKRLQWYYDQKQSKYKHIVRAGRVGFVPLIAASNGAIHKETKFILSMAARRIAERSGTSASGVMGWLRARVSVAILRASSMQLRCERGSNRCRNLGIFNVENVGLEVFKAELCKSGLHMINDYNSMTSMNNVPKPSTTFMYEWRMVNEPELQCNIYYIYI
jgi:hypothetical protein